MRKTILASLGASALALSFAPATASAEPSGGGRGLRMGRAEGMVRVLGLSDQQQEGVRKLMEERRAEHEALREKLEKNREAMRQALDSPSPDPAAVGKLAIEANELHQERKAFRDAHDGAVRELLTAEQKVKFDVLKALRDEGLGGPPEGGSCPRPGRAPRPRE